MCHGFKILVFPPQRQKAVLYLSFNIGDFNFGKRLSVAVFLLVSFSSFLVKYNHFVSFDVTDHGSRDFSSIDSRGANIYFSVFFSQKHVCEVNFVSFVCC